MAAVGPSKPPRGPGKVSWAGGQPCPRPRAQSQASERPAQTPSTWQVRPEGGEHGWLWNGRAWQWPEQGRCGRSGDSREPGGPRGPLQATHGPPHLSAVPRTPPRTCWGRPWPSTSASRWTTGETTRSTTTAWPGPGPTGWARPTYPCWARTAAPWPPPAPSTRRAWGSGQAGGRAALGSLGLAPRPHLLCPRGRWGAVPLLLSKGSCARASLADGCSPGVSERMGKAPHTRRMVLRRAGAGPGRGRGGAGAGPGSYSGGGARGLWGGAGEGSAVPACWGRPLKPGAPGRLCESAPRSRRPAPPPSAALEPWCTHHARASFSTTSFWTCAGGTHRALEPPPRPVSTGPPRPQPRVREGGPVWRRWIVPRLTETERAALGGWLGSESALTRVWPPVPGERPPSSMVPSILVSTARGSKLVIGGAGGELIISAVAQVSLGTPG